MLQKRPPYRTDPFSFISELLSRPYFVFTMDACSATRFASRLPATEADLKLFGQIEENPYTAVISDALDELGYRDQALREFIRPLSTNDRFAGWGAHALLRRCEAEWACRVCRDRHLQGGAE